LLLGIETKIATMPKAIRPSKEAQPEQQPDRELLTARGGGDVEAEDARERAEEQQQPGRAAQISAEVGAKRGESDRDTDGANDLAEQRPSLVVRDRLYRESQPVGGRLERAHVTTTATETPRRRSAEAIPAPSTTSS
jgi:hypothetical protein